MQEEFQHIIADVHEKRRSGSPLSKEELVFLLLDCILDRQLFVSPNWNWRYGGVRHEPTNLDALRAKKILVMQWPGAIGDVAMTFPVFSVLREKYADAEISFFTSTLGQMVFMGNPAIDVLVRNPLDQYLDQVMYNRPIDTDALLRDIVHLVSMLERGQYDLLVNLQVLPLTAVLARLSGVRHTIGMTLSSDGMPLVQGGFWAAYLFAVSAGLLRRHNAFHRTEIFTRMVDEKEVCHAGSAFQISPKAAEDVQRFFDKRGIKDGDLVVGINPMAGTPIRMWGHYDTLAKQITNHMGAKVIIFGSHEERKAIERIANSAGQGVIAATEFDLQELLAAICGCDLFLTNDTGPMHLACLLKRKVLALFGPTSPIEVGPWQTEFHVLQSLACKDCYSQKCFSPEDFCMERIKVEDVFGLVEQILKGDPVRGIGGHLHYRYSGNAHSESLKDELLRQSLVLRVLQNDNCFFERAVVPYGAKKSLKEEARRVHAMAQTAIEGLESLPPRDLHKVTSINKMIFNVDSPLKPIFVFNDFRFLDKRFDVEERPGGYLEFYRNILKNVQTMERFFGSTSSWVWPEDNGIAEWMNP